MVRVNFISYLFSEAAIGFLVLAPVLALFHFFAVRRLPQGSKMPIWHLAAVYVFAFTLIAVFSITGVPDAYSMRAGASTLNLIPFDVFRTNYVQYFQNVLLFMPLGVLLPAAWERFKNGFRTVLAGFALSLLIETLQIFSFRACDIDDLMMNTLGAALGWLVFIVAKRIIPKISVLSIKSEGMWRYELILCVASALAVVIFVLPPVLALA